MPIFPPRYLTRQGQLVSFLSFLSYFTILPAILKIFWSNLLMIQSITLYFVIIVGSNILVLVIYNIFMMYVYNSKIKFFQKYRNTNKPWPWESDPIKWRSTLIKTFGTLVLNMFIFTPLLIINQYRQGELLYQKSLQDWPSSLRMLWQVIVFLLVQDCLFYWFHRTLHHPKLYWIHKKHHQYNITISLAATYSHPIDYILGSIATGLGYSLLSKFTGVHYVTIFTYMVIRMIETCEGHCGYDWSWGQMSFLPWKNGPDYHDFHHSQNSGNYGSLFGFWDTIMGTNRQYYKKKCTEKLS